MCTRAILYRTVEILPCCECELSESCRIRKHSSKLSNAEDIWPFFPCTIPISFKTTATAGWRFPHCSLLIRRASSRDFRARSNRPRKACTRAMFIVTSTILWLILELVTTSVILSDDKISIILFKYAREALYLPTFSKAEAILDIVVKVSRWRVASSLFVIVVVPVVPASMCLSCSILNPLIYKFRADSISPHS